MRHFAVLLLAVSLACLSISPVLAVTDSAKQDAAAAEPAQKFHHHHDKAQQDKDQTKNQEPSADQPSADKAKTETAPKDAVKDAKPAADKAKATADAEKAKPVEKAPVKKDAAKKNAAKKNVVVQFTLRGEYPERAGAAGLFGEMQPSLAALIQRMDSAASDPAVGAVWLKLESPAIGRAKVFELRAAIARLRKANKRVYAELTTAGGPEYLLAGACNQVCMPSSGMLIIPGVRAEITFYKGLLDKLGLQFDALQMGQYKGAAEPLTRNAMSKPLRESYDALVDDIYDDLLTTITADRHLKDYQVKTYLDKGLFTAAAAKSAGLIDEVLYADQIEDAIKKSLKCDELEVVTKYKKKKIDTDFSGISGMMKLADLFLGNKPSDSLSKKPKVAVIYAVGPIVEGKSKSDLFGDSTLGSATIVDALRQADGDAQVSAIILRIDSPGGSAVASDLIWRETVRTKKPVIASMGDVAGSGGYYIAMGAKKIFAAPGTLTGSIGVIGGKLVTRGLYDKLGLTTEVISRGANSGSMSSSQPFTPDERKAWTELLEETYRQFVGKAAEGRKMTYSKLQEMAQGRVYTGRMAKKLGLIDELGTLEDAVVAAKAAAGLKADAEVDLMVLPEPRSIFEQIFGDPSASTDLDSLLPEGLRLLRQTASVRQVLSERILLWMPYAVRVE